VIRDERGFTLIELLVGTAISLVTMSVVAMMVVASTHNQARVANRVEANQRVRPVLTRIIDQLHSACVAPRIIPVRGDNDTAHPSTNTRLTFLSLSGDAVMPTPEKHVIELSGGTLRESVFPATSGAAPDWSFSLTPRPGDPRTLLTEVSAPGGVMFKYHRFQNGQLVLNPSVSATPSLRASDAALVAYVGVSITAAPSGGPGRDAKSPITLSDGASLRLQPASQIPTQNNLPCT
jgi:type II secretory pathway pseudopilin PulG